MFGLIKSSSALSDLIAFMRSNADSIPIFLESGPVLGTPELGKKLYRTYCIECHGNQGEGIEAPALNNQEFLNAATNGFLLATVTLGRNGTPMPEWGKATTKHRMLTPRERHHIIAYIRQWQTLTIKRESSDPIYKLLSAD
jgi:cytochrome c oxidase cbb3-type subunit 3